MMCGYVPCCLIFGDFLMITSEFLRTFGFVLR